MKFLTVFKTSIIALLLILLGAKAKATVVDSVIYYDNKLKQCTNFLQRKQFSTKLNSQISLLSNEDNYNAIDTLTAVTVLKSDDKKIKIFSWEIATDSASFEYYCIAIIKTKDKYLVQNFIDKSADFKNAELASSSPIKWFGAHYYQLIEKKFGDKKYYTLIGINWKSILSKKKVIDTFSLDSKNNVVYSEPIFNINGKLQRRIILEYKFDISISCRYYSEKKMIVFDHLIPSNPSLKNLKQFYVNDLSFDALKFEKGKWNFIEDVDARNSKSKYDDTYSAPK